MKLIYVSRIFTLQITVSYYIEKQILEKEFFKVLLSLRSGFVYTNKKNEYFLYCPLKTVFFLVIKFIPLTYLPVSVPSPVSWANA